MRNTSINGPYHGIHMVPGIRTWTSRAVQRRCMVLTVFLVECVVWVNALESGIAKLPVLVLGTSLVFALYFSGALARRTLDMPPAPVALVLSIHGVLFVISAILSYDRVYTPAAMALGFSGLACLFAGSMLFSERPSVNALFTALAWLTAALCLIALAQLIFGNRLPLDFNTGPDRRVSSLLGNSVYFSSYLVMVFPIVLIRALQGSRGTRHAILRMLGPAGVVTVLFATRTRSSIVGWLVSLIVLVFLMTDHRRLRVTLLVIAGLAGSAILYIFLVDPSALIRASALPGEHREASLLRREYIWKAGLKAFRATPLAGHGIGSFERTTFVFRDPDYWQPGTEDVVPHAHNEVLEIAVEYGAVGLIVMAVTLAIALRRGIRLSLTGDTWQRTTFAAITSSLAGVAFDNLANVSLRIPPVAAPAWLLLGLLWSGASGATARKTGLLTPKLPMIVSVVPLLAWAAFATGYGRSQVGVIGGSVHLLSALRDTGSVRTAALEAYHQAIDADPENLFARLNLSLELVNEGRWGEALLAAEDLQHLCRNFPKSSLVKAYALLHLGRYEKALRAITEEIRLRDHPEAFFVQAVANHELQDTSGERAATINLLRKDLEAGILYQYRLSCKRLTATSGTDAEKRETLGVLDSVETLAGTDHGFFDPLRARLRTDARP